MIRLAVDWCKKYALWWEINYCGPFGGGGFHVRKFPNLVIIHYFAFGCQFWHRCYNYHYTILLLAIDFCALQSLHLGVHCGIRLSLILAHVTFVQRGYIY